MSDYTDQLEAKLVAARKRVRQGSEIKALKSSAPTLFEIIDDEISLLATRTFGDKPLAYDEYLSAHGEMKGIKRIRNLIDAKEVEQPQASAEAKGIEANLKQIQDDKKQ